MSATYKNRGLEPLDEESLESVSGGGCGCGGGGGSFDWRKRIEMYIYRRIAEAGGGKSGGKSGGASALLGGRMPNQNGSTNSGSTGNT